MVAQHDHDGVRAYFDRSAVAVRSFFGHMEKDFIVPALDAARKFSNENPVTAFAVAIFFSLSTLPIIAFLAFSVFILASFTFTALTVALLTSSALIGISGVALLATLSVTLFLSAIITGFSISAYLIARLFTLLRTQETLSSGALQWRDETKEHITSRFWGSGHRTLAAPSHQLAKTEGSALEESKLNSTFASETWDGDESLGVKSE